MPTASDFHLFQHVPQVGFEQEPTANDDGINLRSIAYVIKWIGVEQNQVGRLTLLDRTPVTQLMELFGTIARCRL
jgi:hypothetical protein